MSRPELTIIPRIGEDGRQKWGEPEFRDVLGYMGCRLGLQGSFHMVNDVVEAFDRLLDTRPEEMPTVLSQVHYATEQAEDVKRISARMIHRLRQVQEICREARAEQVPDPREMPIMKPDGTREP